MILNGFEIENWNCIRKLTVSDLPATGVVVLHGPNRTGKSSIVKALRACLMDYASTTTALKSCYPRGSSEKPVVAVTFTCGGTTYRITKCFGSNKSELASRTATGAWRVETATAAEAHSRICDFAGGDDSSKGLRQLLWLTQAEFRLPDAKKFDAGVQSQLRSILGVLQTPLDDRFIERVKKHWSTWHSGQRKAGKQPTIKDSCNLAQNLKRLAQLKDELTASEARFNDMEALLRQTGDLETRKCGLVDQLQKQTKVLEQIEAERQRCQARVAARNLAEQQHAAAIKELEAAQAESRDRADAFERCQLAERDITPARERVEILAQALKLLDDSQAELQRKLGLAREERRTAHLAAQQISLQLQAFDDCEKLAQAEHDLAQADELAASIDQLEKQLRESPAPDKARMAALQSLEQRLRQLRADRDAASMILKLVPLPGAGSIQLAIDNGPEQELAAGQVPEALNVRRKAQLVIPAWGRLELTRGAAQNDVDQIESQLEQAEREFAASVTAFGIAADDPEALDKLRQRAAENQVNGEELQKQRSALKKLAPQGSEPLQRRVLELRTKLTGKSSAEHDRPPPADRPQLEAQRADLAKRLESLDGQAMTLEKELADADTSLTRQRGQLSTAKETLAACNATANGHREALNRMPAEEAIAARLAQANRQLETAQEQLAKTALTPDEATIDDRLAACKGAVQALQQQIRETEDKANWIKGRLEESEGLHARRAALAARVEELTRVTQGESLEREAVDRLYELFEECRDKQLGALMTPIHNRVINWMQVLNLGDYHSLQFNDSFLPEKLIRRDGTAELSMDEESTGAQEQIGMLVRLALGSILTTAQQPAIAILDDPLTHCDASRLGKMRAILKRAAEGDPKLTPAAGPLQILIFTCHPEWFRDEQAAVIDLEDVQVMQRYPV